MRTTIRRYRAHALAALCGPWLLAAALTAPAQDLPPDPIDEFYRQFNAQPDEYRRFLLAYGYPVGGDEALAYEVGQMLATEYGFYGRPNDADRQMPFWEELPDAYALPTRRNHVALPALDWVAARAASRQVVMINEAHHRNTTRRLTLALLPRLRALGYTHLALETLDAADTELAQRGYPLYSRSGYYSGDPIYAELIREALRLGYTLVPYDSAGIPGQTQQQRETRQAEHLVERVLRANPQAKLLVHAGYAHIDKGLGGFGPTTRPMAMEFQRLTGIEPLSVEQAILSPAPPGEPASVADRLAAEFRPTQPSVLLARGTLRPWALWPNRHDATVIFADTPDAVVRPDWMRLGGRRVPVDLSAYLQACLARLPCALEARYAGDRADAVPADQTVVLTAAERRLPLYLRPGRYDLKVRDGSGQIVGRRLLKVCAPGVRGPACARPAFP
ncbi:hypothetical protein [Lysobacter silvisoli]|uniref:Uncharacterized protein n=1 Tax=Lysobacter silvisoli TaxID=2293254 RepID=A0A371K3L1_9GAMM|nr:hypothetical protein [Lysobacter silvisoli]RDZ28427.1 hypothetical protein DX914_04625 [Lysobacter silvisoli]